MEKTKGQVRSGVPIVFQTAKTITRNVGQRVVANCISQGRTDVIFMGNSDAKKAEGLAGGVAHVTGIWITMDREG